MHLIREVLRGGKAILMRGEYEKSLLKSLGEINTKSTKLMSEATKSHIYETHMCMYLSEVNVHINAPKHIQS